MEWANYQSIGEDDRTTLEKFFDEELQVVLHDLHEDKVLGSDNSILAFRKQNGRL